MVDGDLYRWSSGKVGAILRNPVYAGDLTLLKTEVVNHKTGQIAKVDEDRRVVIRIRWRFTQSRNPGYKRIAHCPDGGKTILRLLPCLRTLKICGYNSRNDCP